MFFRRDPQPSLDVVVYSMGCDGSDAVYDSMSHSRGINAFMVHSLDRVRITNMIMSGSVLPDHVIAADQVLRDYIDKGAPLHIITMVPEPFERHLLHCFYKALNTDSPQKVTRLLSRANDAAAYFQDVPPEETTEWFADEYRISTGIDAFSLGYDPTIGSLTVNMGAHRLLLMSSLLHPRQQTRVLRRFLGRRTNAVKAKAVIYAPLRDLFAAHVITGAPPLMAKAFRASRHATHFLSPDQRSRIQKEQEESAQRILKLQDTNVVRSLAGYMMRNSSISRPLELLESMGSREEKVQKDIGILRAQHTLLHAPFPFSTQAARTLTTSSRSVIYNAHQSLPFHTSGYATRTHGLVGAIMDHNWDVSIVTRAGYPRDTRIDPAGKFGLEIDEVPYRYDAASTVGQWELPFDQYIDMSASYLCRHALTLRPAIIHTASNFLCGIAGVEAARRLGLPSIYEMRGLWHITRWSKEPDYNTSEKFALAQKLELETAHAATHVLAITGALRDWLVLHGVDGDKITLAPNAVDVDLFSPLPPDRDFARDLACDDKIVISYIGSFVEYEGLDTLLEAVAMLPEAHKQKIRLLWMGDGPILPGLLENAQKMGIGELIVSLGRRPFEDVPAAYAITDICVFPRKSVPICELIAPLKPFEAMAMQKAIVVSDVGPLREIVTPDVTGVVFEKDNAASLSAQLSRLIDDEALRKRCGVAARAWVEEHRQWRKVAAGISDVYARLTAQS